jgi:hypothetical protein
METAAPHDYVQVARMGGTSAAYGTTLDAPPVAHPREEKRIVVRLAKKEEVEAIKEQTREDITGRIQRVADEMQEKYRVIAVQKLRSENLAIHVDSLTAKKNLEAETGWVESIAPRAMVKRKTWRVLVHGVWVADYPPTALKEHTKHMQAETPGHTLKIFKVRWLDQTIRKDFAPLVVEVDTVEQANRLINEGIALAFDLKMVEWYDPKCRIIQYFKYQRYGHKYTLPKYTEVWPLW